MVVSTRRSQKRHALNVWMNGELVGTWTVFLNAASQFQYDEDWIQSRHVRALSLSLPIQPGNQPHSGQRVDNYFENLLPDSEPIRERLQSQFSVASTGAFDLLAEIGRDCVGAVQLLPPTETPQGWDHIHSRALSNDDIEYLLQAVATPGRWDVDHQEFRISIAGAQEKTALLWHNDCWHQPLGATPTTHMFKLPLGLVGNMQADMHSSVENEWLCAQILQAYGVPVANCSINQFGDQKVLVVERFDRKLSSDGSHWLRLPQEDMCQATGTHPNIKYEAHGGPGIAEIMSVLDGSSERLKDKVDFFKAQIIFWLLAATDGHAKNFSLAHGSGGAYKMTPLYDVLSTWPIIGKGNHHLAWEKAKLAMSIRSKNKHYVIPKIQRRHFEAMAQTHGLGHVIDKLFAELIDTTETVIEKVSALLPNAFPEAVAQVIFDGMRSQVKRLQ